MDGYVCISAPCFRTRYETIEHDTSKHTLGMRALLLHVVSFYFSRSSLTHVFFSLIFVFSNSYASDTLASIVLNVDRLLTSHTQARMDASGTPMTHQALTERPFSAHLMPDQHLCRGKSCYRRYRRTTYGSNIDPLVLDLGSWLIVRLRR
jgi:hypothetical protein